MNTPPLLVGVALVYWGWRMDLLWLGLSLGALLEGARWSAVRWEFRQSDLDRLWNFCVALYFGILVFGFVVSDYGGSLQSLVTNPSPANRVALVNRGARSMFFVFQWMPAAFFAMALAQAWGAHRRMAWSTFSWWLRRARSGAESEGASRDSGVNVGYAYFALCVLASSAVGTRRESFFAIVAFLLGWALWSRRPRPSTPTAWWLCLALVLGLGYAGQAGFLRVRRALERLDAALLAQWNGGSTDPRESRTRIGALGELKLSGRVVLRLEGQNPPELLHEATYNVFRPPTWLASRREFVPLLPESDPTTWLLGAGTGSTNEVRLRLLLPGGQGVLPLPHDAMRLDELSVFLLETNRLGVVRSAAGPGYVEFKARFGGSPVRSAGPDAEDLEVPESELAAVEQVVREIGLPAADPFATVARVRDFFAQHFRYSTYPALDLAQRVRRSSLAEFLLQRRAGHCEYFATATTLLLRQAGIPARYAVGFAVGEQVGQEYVVRQRHAHAWCLAWLPGGWQVVDTTPGSWLDAESQGATWWESLSDQWSRVKFALARWRAGRGEARRYLGWLMVPLVVGLAVQLIFRRQWRRAGRADGSSGRSSVRPGADSEFYRIEQALAAAGWERLPGESLCAWTRRLESEGVGFHPELDELVWLHYRLRFDPAGLTKAERGRLAERANAWLTGYERARR
ncbi:MAG TPA: transglutaminase-like domain-containing protein [Methylomirabilota bacterium]|nr:transglutaminase-like domain-containing protein [Methylomirabilota bacterium]